MAFVRVLQLNLVRGNSQVGCWMIQLEIPRKFALLDSLFQPETQFVRMADRHLSSLAAILSVSWEGERRFVCITFSII